MKIEIGKKTQTIITVLLLIGAASAISEYGNNINISGNIDAVFGNFTNVRGNGSGISALNANNLTTGVLPNASIPLSAANLSAANNTFTGNVSAKNIGGVIYADQYATLQDAVNAIDNTTGGTIIAPSTYILSKELNIEGKHRLVIDGMGTGKITQGTDTRLYYLIANFPNGSGVSGVQYYNNVIRGMTIDFNEDAQSISYSILGTTGSVIALRDCVDCIIENNKIINASTNLGINVFSSDYRPAKTVIRNNNLTDSGVGVWLTSATPDQYTYYTVQGNYGGNASVNSFGIYIEGTSGNIIQNNVFLGGYSSMIYSPVGNAIRDTLIFSNQLNMSGANGISLAQSNNSLIMNNVVNDTRGVGTLAGILVSGKNNIVISNIVKNGRGTGIYMGGGVAIGNYIGNNQYAGYYTDTHNTSVLQNIFDGNIYDIRGSGVNNIIYENGNVFLNSTAKYTGIIFAEPHDFGKAATAPTASGFGDKYSNSTSLDFTCGYTGSQWQNSTGNTIVC